MPAATSIRDPLELLALACRKGDATLLALAGLARGETLDEGTVEQLRRSGLIEAGPPRLDPRLFAPVLALEAALGLAGEQTLNQLLSLLRGAGSRAARDTLLVALAEELSGHLDALAEGVPVDAFLLDPIMLDLQQVIGRLSARDADPALVTRVAELTARLVERLAKRLRMSARKPKTQKDLPLLPIQSWAGAMGDLRLRLPTPVQVPSPGSLARALAAPEFLPGAPVRAEGFSEVAGRGERRQTIKAALTTSHPVRDLYLGQSVSEALRRHNTLVGLGRDVLDDAECLPTAEVFDGPAPLAWTTVIKPVGDSSVLRNRQTAARAAA